MRKRTQLARWADEAAELEPAAAGTGTDARGARRRLRTLADHSATLRAELESQEAAELELWAELWATPQAVAWERLRWTREVAQYVRWSCAAASGVMEAGREARQWSDRLGLNPLALLRLRWEIVETELAEVRPIRSASAVKRRGVKAVD